ncbi:MarR family transcriptional regulator [Clostridium sulfidigenes]|uniref:MarR family transcriptional regulator n=1 Tax=Clostridium sulfidigenes TaxID=318464 RepID=A0A084J982_9CLOT|nr:MarR family transcriptional regulator [Clostridium sulfidigenes]KEZ85516.1 MarR family transcriptional regulator [Clostridium sulfidigenes]MBE6060072.1 MarR family transcriptional regulator [Clostridium sulfidigenes]
MFDLDDCIAFITNKSAKKLADEFNRRLQENGTTRVQWIALFYIGKAGEISQKELSDYMDIKESSMVRLIDRMEKEELVERRKDSEDRRITKIILTDKGKFLKEELMPRGQEFQDDVLKGISKENLEIFKEVLQRMIDNIC